jgi:hypothetical protein
MADEQEIINEAFETFQESYLSKESHEKITALYGERIAARVKAIYEDALKCPVDWRTATIDTALPVLHELLTSKYPWLSGKARSKITGAFIVEWK